MQCRSKNSLFKHLRKSGHHRAESLELTMNTLELTMNRNVPEREVLTENRCVPEREDKVGFRRMQVIEVHNAESSDEEGWTDVVPGESNHPAWLHKMLL